MGRCVMSNLASLDYALWVLVALGLYQAAVWVFRGVRAVRLKIERKRLSRALNSSAHSIAAALEIDRDKAEIMLLMGYNIAWTNSAKYESARTEPIRQAVAKLIEAAEPFINKPEDFDENGDLKVIKGVSTICAEYAGLKCALTELRRLLMEKE